MAVFVSYVIVSVMGLLAMVEVAGILIIVV